MVNFRSGLSNFCRTDIARALAISLALHGVLLLQEVPRAPGESIPRGLAAAGGSVDATLRGTGKALATQPAAPIHSAADRGPARPAKSSPAAFTHAENSAPDLISANSGTRETGAAPNPRAIVRGISARNGPLASITPPDDEGVDDSNGLRQYRLGLAVESRRFKRYPPEALEHRWSGTAHVRVALADGGVLRSVQLVKSSGHEVLDTAALEMARQAAPTAAVPASLRGRGFSVTLPVEFRHDPE